MIDLFTLALTHGLIVLALWRLVFRPELDVEDAVHGPARPWVRQAPAPDRPEAVEREPGDA